MDSAIDNIAGLTPLEITQEIKVEEQQALESGLLDQFAPGEVIELVAVPNVENEKEMQKIEEPKFQGSKYKAFVECSTI